MEYSTYKEAIEKSKIPRIPWKAILGMSFTKFILTNKYTNDEEIIHQILLKCRDKKELLVFWNWEDIAKNVKIGVSARRAEQKLYGL